MTLVEIAAIVQIVAFGLGLLLVAHLLVEFGDLLADQARRKRKRNAHEAINPFLHIEPFDRVLEQMVDHFSEQLTIHTIFVSKWQTQNRVTIHIRMWWWTVVGVGYFHQQVRCRAKRMLEKIASDNVRYEIGKVSIRKSTCMKSKSHRGAHRGDA